MSQSELARILTGGTSGANALVSKIEAGRQTLDDSLLQALATALRCSLEFLTREPIEAVATRPWLRAYADASAKVVESVVADNALAHEVIASLKLKRIPDRIPIFDGDLNDPSAIERFAEEVRTAAQIPEGGVVGNVMRAADRLGCVVLPLASELGRHLGLSQRIDGAPVIRASRPGGGEGGVPGDRQRFTVAHELGHLALHAEMPPPESADEARRIERQAHLFAGAFIAPAEPLLEDWQSLGGRVTLSTLAQLKSTWGIAIKSLVIRFKDLQIISADQATSLYKQISKRGWNKAEPVPTTSEEPIWLSRAIFQRTGRDGRSDAVTAAADLAGLSRTYVQPWLDWSPVLLGAEVTDLTSRRRSAVAASAADGEVIVFSRDRR